jgi:hypothetical protein
MDYLSGNTLQEILRGAGVRLTGLITPRKGERKPAILTAGGAMPDTLSRVRYGSVNPSAWLSWTNDTPTDMTITGNGLATLPGVGYGAANIRLFLGWTPIITYIRLTGEGGDRRVRFKTSGSAEGLATANFSSYYYDGDLAEYQCSSWLYIQARVDDASATLTELQIDFDNQLLSDSVLEWGSINSSLTDNGIGYGRFNPKLLPGWGAEKLGALGQDFALVAAPNRPTARDYVPLWHGSVSAQSGGGLSGDLSGEYLVQAFPRYTTADGTYWPTPFGSFTASQRMIIGEPGVALYTEGARIRVNSTTAGAGFRTMDVTLRYDGSTWEASTPDEELTYTGGVITDADDAMILTVSLTIVGPVQAGDYVTIFCRLGGQCPAVWLYDTEDYNYFALSQWPIGEVRNLYFNDDRLSSAFYTAYTNGTFAGREAVAYAIVQKFSKGGGTVTYSGDDSYFYLYSGDPADSFKLTGSPVGRGYIYIQTLDGDYRWRTYIAGEYSDWSDYAPMDNNIPFALAFGLSIVFYGGTTSGLDVGYKIMDGKSEFTWTKNHPQIFEGSSPFGVNFQGQCKLEVGYNHNGSTDLFVYFRETEDDVWEQPTGDLRFAITDGTMTYKGLSFELPAGEAEDQRIIGENWVFDLSRVDIKNNVKWNGVGIEGKTTIPDILTAISEWSPGYENFVYRAVVDYPALATLPEYDIAGQIPESCGTIGAIFAELLQNIADVDASRGVVRVVTQTRTAPTTVQMIIGPADVWQEGEYIGEALAGIQNDISLAFGDGFHDDTSGIVRVEDQYSINRWERITGHGLTWKEEVRYPYVQSRKQAETIARSRLTYKKDILRFANIYPDSMLAAFLHVGDWVWVTDYQLPNDTYRTLGWNLQPCRVEQVAVDLDTQRVTLLVSVAGSLKAPPATWSLPDGLTITLPGDGSLIWDEGTWDEGVWA